MKLFYYFILASLVLQGQAPHEHTPWDLEGAQARIETHRKGEAQLKFVFPEKVVGDTIQLHFELVSHEFNFGVSMTQLGSFAGTPYFEKYKDYTKALFNFVTVGFYWAAYHRDRKDLDRFDAYLKGNIKWAIENNLKVKGHPLLWHESLPKWVVDFKDSEKLDSIIKNRIRYLIESNPEIKYWDVYNEPVAVFKAHVSPSGVTRWVTHKGGIESAMKDLYDFVNTVDSTKTYTNNHYNPSEPSFLALNKYLNDHGVEYDAVGMQAHMQTNAGVLSEDALWKLLNDYESLGKDIQFTELTVTSSRRFNDWRDHQVFLKQRTEKIEKGQTMNLPSLPEYENYQSDYIKDFYTLVFSHPSVTSLTFWNLTDRNAWRGHAGGLLDENLEPKKAYYTLKNLIKNKWHTSVTKTIKLGETLTFNGFYGDYSGEILVNGNYYSFDFNHSKKRTNPTEVNLTKLQKH